MSAQNEAVLADFRATVKRYPSLIWHHCGHSQLCEGPRGLTDLLIIGPAAVLFRECKPYRGARLSPEQSVYRYTLIAAGADWAVWTPEDVADGTMDADLARAAGVSASS